MDVSALLAMRHLVPDATLLDAMELAQLLPDLPCRVRRRDLEGHWRVTQPALHRRLRRLQQFGLLDFETEHGTVWINRLGALPQQPDGVPCADQQQHAHDAAHDRDPDLMVTDCGIDDLSHAFFVHAGRVAADPENGCNGRCHS